jgi:hypothetical protein
MLEQNSDPVDIASKYYSVGCIEFQTFMFCITRQNLTMHKDQLIDLLLLPVND